MSQDTEQPVSDMQDDRHLKIRIVYAKATLLQLYYKRDWEAQIYIDSWVCWPSNTQKQIVVPDTILLIFFSVVV